MSYNLGDIELPRPDRFVRETVETSTYNITLDGTHKKDITNRKERYVLEYSDLTQAQVNSILSEYNLEQVRDFSVSETNLTIAATSVHIDIDRRAYERKGSEYRENLNLVLTEVS